MSTTPQEKEFNTCEVNLSYSEGPKNGPPLLLLHGFTGSRIFYNSIITHLQTKWHLYAIDLRGHGKSGRNPGKYGLGYYYEDLQRFIDSEIKEPATIMGHSKGAVLTCMLASKNREKTRAIILLDPPLRIRESSRERLSTWQLFYTIASHRGDVYERIRFLENLRFDEDGSSIRFTDRFDQYAVLGWAMNPVDPSVIEVKIKAILDDGLGDQYYSWYNPEKVLRMIDCPVLLVQAGVGDTLSGADVVHVKSWVRCVVHVKLRGFDHSLGIPGWNPGEAMRVISPFLESVR